MNVLMLATLALTYAVHAQLPQGEPIAAVVQLNGTPAQSATVTIDGQAPVRVELRSNGQRPSRSIGPVIEILGTAQAIARAAMHGDSSVQVMIGPQRTCVDLAMSRNGDTITATGSAKLSPPDRPPVDMQMRVVVTVDHQFVQSARGEMHPADDSHAPGFAWTLTRTGEEQ